jgi:polar amino acid transport system permease protein
MNPDIGEWLLDLLPGLLVSLELTAVLLAFGLPAAVLLALGLRSRSRLIRGVIQAVVEIAKGMPALVLIYVLYFGLPQVGIDLGAFLSAAAALAISFAGYACDSFKAGFDAVPRGQLEAAHALGLGRLTTFRRVVLPQALKVSLPPVIGWSIVYFQATSLAFAIAVPELLARAYQLATTNFQYFSVIALAALIYAAICIPLSLTAEHLFTRARTRRRRVVAAP